MTQSTSRTTSGLAVGFTLFAAVMMMVVGVLDILQGLAAIIRKHYYVVGSNYVYKINVTTWGWIHLVLGILLGVAGFFLFRGALWARIVGIIGASLVAISNFMWLPYYPVWAALVIAGCAFIIWALTAHGHDIAEA